jgi:hypothetical protein
MMNEQLSTAQFIRFLYLALGGLCLLCISIVLIEPLVAKIYHGQTLSWVAGLLEYLRGKSLGEVSLANVMSGIAQRMVGFYAGCVGLSVICILAAKRGDEHYTREQLIWVIAGVVLLGTLIRLYLAFVPFGNYDMESYYIAAEAAARGENVYAVTYRYPYSPIWFWILGWLKKVQMTMPAIPLHGLVRSWLTLFDLMILCVVLLIAWVEKVSLIRTSVFFFLNPVSFLLTGFHGQIENMTVFFLLVGIYVSMRWGKDTIGGKVILWLSSSFALFIKHNVAYQLVVFVNYSIKRLWVRGVLFGVSAVGFLALFIPYWSEADSIVKRVFLFGGLPGEYPAEYGLRSLFPFEGLKYLFLAGVFLFPFLMRSKDLVTRCLSGMLFYLAFNYATGIQYFVLPIAFGALRPDKGFIVYTILASLFILGSPVNVNIPVLSLLSWNIVWVGVVYWFLTSQYDTRIVLKRSQHSPHWP